MRSKFTIHDGTDDPEVTDDWDHARTMSLAGFRVTAELDA